MSEIRDQSGSSRLSRREFLKKAGKTAAKVASGAVGLGGLGKLGQELMTAYHQEPRVETDKAVFLPLYETHNIGIESSAIPPETDYFWDEYVIWSKEPFADNIMSEYSTSALIRFLDERKQSFLPYLAEKNIRLVLGDLVTPQSKDFEEFIRRERDIGMVLLGVSSTRLVDSVLEKIRAEKKGLSRRKFLQAALTGAAGLWLTSPSLGGGQYRETSGGLSLTPKERLVIRAYAIQSQLHPEVTNLFFSNLVWAHKLLDMVEMHGEISAKFREEGISPKANQKTIVAPEIGYKHGGLEDFLRAGKRFCLALIDNLFTAHFISRTAEINLGPKSVATNRILALPPDFATQRNYDDVVEFQHIDAALLSCFQRKID